MQPQEGGGEFDKIMRNMGPSRLDTDYEQTKFLETTLLKARTFEEVRNVIEARYKNPELTRALDNFWEIKYPLILQEAQEKGEVGIDKKSLTRHTLEGYLEEAFEGFDEPGLAQVQKKIVDLILEGDQHEPEALAA